MKKSTALVLVLSASLVLLLLFLNTTATGKRWSVRNIPPTSLPSSTGTTSSGTFRKLKINAAEARKFIREKGFNNHLCFMINMSLPSGQNRFFVYDLEKDSVKLAGLVTHGRCNEDWLEGRRYGNKVGCGCTSLGKYQVGLPYQGRFGLAFKLHGLEATNSNAYARFVVLHSHSCVPAGEVKNEICQSDGCPTVSPPFLAQLEPIIRKSKKPVLLWIVQ